MTHRRDILRLLAASPFLLSSCRPKDRPGEPIGLPREESVIVIGAGIAGLAAAQELKQYKVNVVVLEARDRIGGRIHTDRTWKAPMDLGASWIHGVRRNPLTALARKFDVETKHTDYGAQVFYDNGKALTKKQGKELESQFYELFDKIQKKASSMQKAEKIDVTVDDAVQEFLPQGTTPEQEYRRMQHMLSVEIDNEYAASPEELSLFHWQEGRSLRGDDALVIGGYDSIIKKLAEGVTIKLNHAVSQINYSENGVELLTSQGPISADRVIITIPLGVLKNKGVIFSPELPASKQSAIENLGFGLLDKVFLRFPKSFWGSKDIEIFQHISPLRGNFPYIVNMEHYTGVPALQMFIGASVAESIELQREREITERAMSALREMFGESIPEPEDYKITRWRQDAFSQGSYSFMAYGSSPESFDALAAPVEGRLFFAGEATNRDFNATVHGAYLSGIREALRWR